MNLFRRIVKPMVYRLRPDLIYRQLHRQELRILMYHRFGDRSGLEQQCRLIRKYYNPVSMNQVARWLRGEIELPPFPVAVTVDDGYRDFADIAAPIFESYQIPVTVFVVTSFVEGEDWLWTDKVKYMFAETSRHELIVEVSPTKRFHFKEIRDLEVRARAATEVTEALKFLPPQAVASVIRQIEKELGVHLPQKPPVGYEPLSWEQIRYLSLRGQLFDFGAHTHTHPILSKLTNYQEIEREVYLPKKKLEDKLQRPVVHFCYPNGRVVDFDERAVRAVQSCGYKTAVTTSRGINKPTTDPYRLSRLGVEPDLNSHYFLLVISGYSR